MKELEKPLTRDASQRHQLDRAVDLCYRPQPFDTDRHRVEHLFGLYEELTAPLIATGKKRRRNN